MINKYTLIFKDKKLENIFQQYMISNIRLPLFKKVIISSTLLFIIESIEILIEYNDDFPNKTLQWIQIGLGFLCVLCFLIIYKYYQKYTKYALLFYNHLLIVQYAFMDNFNVTVQQKLVYTIGILVFQIVNALSGEFSEAVYQTIAFGSFYLIGAFWNDNTINYSLIALILAAMVILISAFYENIRALRSQFKLGKIDNQWESIFKSLVKEQEYLVFYYNESSYSFNLNQQYLQYQVNTTQELRNLLRSTKTEKKLTLEQYLFEQISLNEEQNNIINKEVLVSIQNNRKTQVTYSIFYGFNTIVLLQFKGFCENAKSKQYTIERLYQSQYKQFLTLMIKAIRKFNGLNAVQLLYSLRKYCFYAHLKDVLMNDSKLQIKDKFVSPINFSNILKTLKLIYLNKKISFKSFIANEIIGCKQYLLIILMEITEMTLSQEVFFMVEQDYSETFTIKVYCNFNEKSSAQLSQRIKSYWPYLVDIQFQLQYFIVTFKSFNSLFQFQEFLEENETKRNQLA